MHKYLALLWH